MNILRASLRDALLLGSSVTPTVARRLIPSQLKAVLVKAAGFGPAEKPTTADVVIISYPKSGRTWFRVMLGKIYAELANRPDSDALGLYQLCLQAGLPTVMMTHDGSSANSGNRYWEMDRDKSRYSDCKVVILSRDVRDTLVSNYHAAIHRDRVYQGSVGDFVRSDVFGIHRIVEYYNIWWENRSVPRDFLHLSYEAIHVDPAAALHAMLSFQGVELEDPGAVDRAIDFARFDRLQKREQQNYFGSGTLQPADPGNVNSFKVRSGIVGGFSDTLSPEDIDYIEQVVADRGSPLVPLFR